MLIDSVVIVLGFVGLIWGADLFVLGASSVARSLGVSPLLIGLTIVAFGTSSPEIFSSAVAALEDKPELAIGNAIGSNLFNVGVALGVAILVKPLRPPPGSLNKRELPALLLVSFIAGLLLVNYELGLADSVLLLGVIGFLGYRLFKTRTGVEVLPPVEGELRSVPVLKWAVYKLLGLAGMSDTGKSRTISVVYLLLGLGLLMIGAEALVHAAGDIAAALDVSPAVIGLTVVALGTSLPELAASVTCVLRGHHALAIGNIVGSNILNLLAVLPFPGLLSPGAVEAQLVERDLPFMLLLTLLLAWCCRRSIKQGRSIGRLAGAVFLLIYGVWFGVMLGQAL